MTATQHNSGDNCEGQNMATMIMDSTTPPKVCVDVGQAPSVVSGKQHPPSVEDVGHTPSDMTVMSCKQGKLGAH